MNLFLTHLNYMPFIYGVVLFLSTVMIMRNFASGQILRGGAVVLVLWIGFSIHGDASDTRMGVAIAALLVDFTWPLFFGRS
jgi:hypothetical protein